MMLALPASRTDWVRMGIGIWSDQAWPLADMVNVRPPMMR